MRIFLSLTTVLLLASCAESPPKPPVFQGVYHPINTEAAKQETGHFDFVFKGDIVDALKALHETAPQLSVLSPEGQVTPLFVSVDLHNTTTENVLRVIGEQGGNMADVVLNLSSHGLDKQAFIRFRARVVTKY